VRHRRHLTDGSLNGGGEGERGKISRGKIKDFYGGKECPPHESQKTERRLLVCMGDTQRKKNLQNRVNKHTPTVKEVLERFIGVGDLLKKLQIFKTKGGG